MDEGVPIDYTIVAFGSASSDVVPVAGVIDVSNGPAYAFSVPRNGVITSISAYFSVATSFVIPAVAEIVVRSELWCSPTAGNFFTPVPGTMLLLAPPIVGILTPGTSHKASLSGLAIPVVADARCMLVFAASWTGGFVLLPLTGYAGGGISIQ